MCKFSKLFVDVMDLNQQHCLYSYTLLLTLPSQLLSFCGFHFIHLQEKKVEDIGVEPMTPCVQGRCSSQLS